MTEQLIIYDGGTTILVPDTSRLIDLATNGLEENTRQAYTLHLERFLRWATDTGQDFSRATVQAYKQHLMNEDYAPATVNLALTAIRRLAEEGKFAGLDPLVAEGIMRVKNVAKGGRRLGHWLSPDQMKSLFDCTDRDTLKGHQERLILALLGGCALRRSEAAELTFEQVQERDGITLIVDLEGKGNKIRTVPMSPWVIKLFNKWKEAAGIDTGLVLRAINKADRLTGPVRTKNGGMTDGGVSAKGIYKTVVAIAERCGIQGLGPHSLRRTWARRAYKQGYPLDQVQIVLGHASIRTTEIYIGIRGLDLESPLFVTY